MNTYQKKPIQISAVNLTVENAYDVMTWANHIQPADKQIKLSIESGLTKGLIIPTKEGDMLCGIDDYRMFYPCKADMFELTYEYVVPVL